MVGQRWDRRRNKVGRGPRDRRVFGVRSGEVTNREIGDHGGDTERSRDRPFPPASGGSRGETAVAVPAVPVAKLLREAPQESSSSPRAPGVPAPCARPASARAELCSQNSCPRRASPRLAASILLRCRSRPGSGSPCPAGGSTQARSPARGSPGGRGAGSILPGSHGRSVRAGGGDRPVCRPTSSYKPPPLLPHAHGATAGAAHLLATRPPPPGCPPHAPGPGFAAPAPAPARRSLRCPSALRGVSLVAVATRSRKSEPASERGRRGSQSRLRSPCAHSPSRRGGGARSRAPRVPNPGCCGGSRWGEKERKPLDSGFRKYPVFSPPSPPPAAAFTRPPSFLSRVYSFTQASKHRHTQIQRLPVGEN